MALANPTITLLGHVCIDHNRVDNGAVVKQWGSPLLYMADYLSTPPHIIAPHGKDLYEHIDQDMVVLHAPTHTETLVYENIVENNKRTQYAHRIQSAAPAPITEDQISILNRTDIFVVAPITPDFSISYIKDTVIPHLPAHSLKLLLPQGYLRHIRSNGLVGPRRFTEANTLVPLFDVIVLSDEDGNNPHEAATSWVRAAPHVSVVVTESSRGASIISPHGKIHVPTTPISPSDMLRPPVGCGDIFSIALLMALYSGKNLEDAVQRGHQAVRQRLLGAIE